MAKFTLSKNERLKSKKAIDLLFENGQFINRHPIKLVYQKDPLPEGRSSLLFSVSVSKRNFKSAVDRNRIKRLVREAYRTQCIPLKEQTKASKNQIKMMFIYVGKKLPHLEDVKSSVQILLSKLEEI